MSPKSYRRGYPVAVLIGIEQNQAALWQVFSQVAKHQQNISLNGDRNDSKSLYNFHESIINAIRPILKEGIRSIIMASPSKTDYAQQLLNHIKGHHNWLSQGSGKAVFSMITGSASTPSQVAALTQTSMFKQLISDTTAEETENLLEILEKRLNTTDNLVLFSLIEAEHLVLDTQADGKPKPEYLMLTDEYLTKSRQKYRIQRLMQVAANKGVKTRVINAESTAGKRLTQFGGIVCLAKHE
jgi:stalled ribosome rescue protein Dom34